MRRRSRRLAAPSWRPRGGDRGGAHPGWRASVLFMQAAGQGRLHLHTPARALVLCEMRAPARRPAPCHPAAAPRQVRCAPPGPGAAEAGWTTAKQGAGSARCCEGGVAMQEGGRGPLRAAAPCCVPQGAHLSAAHQANAFSDQLGTLALGSSGHARSPAAVHTRLEAHAAADLPTASILAQPPSHVCLYSRTYPCERAHAQRALCGRTTRSQSSRRRSNAQTKPLLAP
jgi:hypothetical protein